jgi:hypothetical protein
VYYRLSLIELLVDYLRAMPRSSAMKQKAVKSSTQGLKLRRAVTEKPFSRRYRTEVAVTKLTNKSKTLWNAGMDCSEWFTHKGTILWTFQQFGVSNFFLPAERSYEVVNGVTVQLPTVEEECPASRDPIDIDAEVELWRLRKTRIEKATYREILAVIELLPDTPERDQKVIDTRIRHVERMGKIKSSKEDMVKEVTHQEKDRKAICETFDGKLKDCATAIAKCFHEQFLRDYEYLLSAYRFREFLIKVDEINSNQDVGQTKTVQSLQEIQLARYSTRSEFSDSIRHFDTLLAKHEGVGGSMDDETKKYYLFQSLKNSNFPKTFSEAVQALVVYDNICAAQLRLSYDAFLSQVMTLHRKSDLEEIIEANSGSHTAASAEIASIKHTNKNEKKGKTREFDPSKVTCYACGKKGHFRGAPECKGKKEKTSSSDSDSEPLNLETEFVKATKKGK